MNHLDEGTIHAWLDGALDETRARDVESHVAGCAECTARVAEARGLIAGSSRILSALDDVPGGVLPTGSRPAPQPPAAVTPIRSARRNWRAAPWVTGIAAVLVAAVVLRTSTEVARNETVADRAARAAADTVQALIDAPSPIAPAPATALAGGGDASRAGQSPAGAAAPSPAAPQPEQPREPQADDATRRERQGIAAGAAAAAANRRRAETASAPPTSQPGQIGRGMVQKAAVSDMATVAAADADARGLAGCYVVSFAGPTPLAQTEGAARVERRSAAPAVAPTAAASSGSTTTLANAQVVALTLAPADSGFVIRSVRDDTARSVAGTWRAFSPDSAELRLVNGARIVVPRAIRNDCPQARPQ